MDQLLAEYRRGQRNGSIVSALTVESLMPDERETWRQLRRDLKDVGIETTIIEEKREFIVAWFARAVAEYGLDGIGSDDGYTPSEDDGEIQLIGTNRQTSFQ
jgi:hypothetical protein